MRTRPRKRVTIRQIAKLANVSPTAVSMARANHPQISEETRRRVHRVCQQLGYEGKRRSSVGTARVGFMLLGGRIEHVVNAALLQAVTDVMTAQEIRLEISCIPDPVHDARNVVIERTITFARELDGLMIMGLVNAELLAALDEANIRTVVIGHAGVEPGQLRSRNAVVVAADDAGQAQFATNHLFACGHERVGFTAEIIYPGLSHARWLSGYSAAYALAGKTLDTRLIQLDGVPDGDMDRAARAYLEMPAPPTAWVIPDVRVTWMFLRAMERLGRPLRPEQIIMHGNPSVVAQYHMQDHPMTLVNMSDLAKAAVWHLRSITAGKLPFAAEVLLPFVCKNLPEVVASSAK